MKLSKKKSISILMSLLPPLTSILIFLGALWIKMKQGTLSLSIGSFELNELFELLRKGVWLLK